MEPLDIRVALKREDRPKFERVYEAQLTREVSIKVKLYTSYGGSRYDMSDLRQRDGRWVLFDAKRPADKILDRELLPHVERACEQILMLDRDFLRSDPSEFVDELGHTWRRA